MTDSAIPTLYAQPTDGTGQNALLAGFRAERQHALAEQWLRWLAAQVALAQLAEETVTTYRHAIRPWLLFLDKMARTDAPTPGTVSAYLAALIPGRKPATINLYLSGLRAFYRWAESCDHHADIARAARPLRVQKDGPLPCLPHSAVAGLLVGVTGTTLKALRDRALLTTLYGTAVRTISLARACVGDLDLAAATLRHHPKGHRASDALAYLPAGAVAALSDYLAMRRLAGPVTDDQPLFIAVDHRCAGARLTTCSIRSVVRAAMLRAGFARRGSDGRLLAPGVFSAHSLRRSALTTAADAFGLEVASAIAGHSSIEVTRRSYVRSKLHERMQRASQVLDL